MHNFWKGIRNKEAAPSLGFQVPPLPTEMIFGSDFGSDFEGIFPQLSHQKCHTSNVGLKGPDWERKDSGSMKRGSKAKGLVEGDQNYSIVTWAQLVQVGAGAQLAPELSLEKLVAIKARRLGKQLATGMDELVTLDYVEEDSEIVAP